MDTFDVFRVGGIDVTITVICDPSAVARELRSLKSGVVHSSKVVVGLGVEWNSADVNAKPVLFQFCIRTRCLLLQLQHMFAIPPQLKDFLADSKITFVGVGIQSSVAKLKDGYGLECANAVELATLARDKSYTAASAERDLVQLARDVCQVSISKIPRLPCFYSPSSVLMPNEIRIAVTNAYAAYIVGAKLRKPANARFHNMLQANQLLRYCV